MAQATITPLNFIGRELIATDEPGRFRMGEITELNRESVTNALRSRSFPRFGQSRRLNRAFSF